MTKQILEAIRNIIDDQSKIYFCCKLKDEECHKRYDILKNSRIEITSAEMEESIGIWNSAYKCMNQAYAEGTKAENVFKKDTKQVYGIIKSNKLVNSKLLEAVKYMSKVEGTLNKLIAETQGSNREVGIPEPIGSLKNRGDTNSIDKQIKDNKEQIKRIYRKVRELNTIPEKCQLECRSWKRKRTQEGTVNKHGTIKIRELRRKIKQSRNIKMTC